MNFVLPLYSLEGLDPFKKVWEESFDHHNGIGRVSFIGEYGSDFCGYNSLFRLWNLSTPPTDLELKNNPWIE